MTGKDPSGQTLSVNSSYFERDGKPWMPLMGELHYNRVLPAFWNSEIAKMKSGGLSVVATYVFWNEHEQHPGTWDWRGNRDLRQFLETCQSNGMYVWLRIGPWSHGEQLHGGFPEWIEQMKGKRTNDPAYLEAASKLFKQIGSVTAGMYFKDGGPVIGIQLENEYASGKQGHISTLKKMAQAAGIEPVYWSVTANTVFDDEAMEVIPLQGAYPYRGWEAGGGKATKDFLYGNDQWIMDDALGKVFYDVHKFPKGMCEQGCGSQMTFANRFVVDPHIVEAHLQNQVGRGMNLVGYYMFHGGTQTPGLKEPGLPESYDFQAPIGEYNELRPSYRYLRILHQFINDFGSDLAQMQVVEPEYPVKDPLDTIQLRYCTRVKDNSGFVFLNNAQVRVDMPDKKVHLQVKLPGETIDFPSFWLKGKTSPVLPFNLSVNGVRIKYVTAQLMCRVANGSDTLLFFQRLPGTEPIAAFDAATLKSIDQPAKFFKQKNGVTAISVGQRKSISVTAGNGSRVIMIFLSRQEAENAVKIQAGEKEAMIISTADVNFDDGQIRLSQLGKPSFQFTIYPSGIKYFSPTAITSKGTISDVVVIKGEAVKLPVQLKESPSGMMELIVPENIPAALEDVKVNIDYLGGAAKLLNDKGVVVGDHLFNGTTWVVGINKFLGKGNLRIATEPWNDNITGVAPAIVQRVKAAKPGVVKVTIVPEYKVQVDIIPDSLPAAVSAASFGAIPNDDFNDRSGLQNAVDYCRKNRIRRLLIPPGTYKISDGRAIQLMQDVMSHKMGRNSQDIIYTPYYDYVRGIRFDRINDLEVIADGAVFMVEGWMEPVSLENCKGVTIRGLTIDYATPPHSEGLVTGATEMYFDIRFNDAFFVKDSLVMNRIMFWDKTRNRLAGETIYFPDSSRMIGTDLLRVWAKHPPGITGMMALVNHTFHFRPAVLLLESSATTLDRVTIHAQPGMGIVGHRCTGILLNGLRIVPRPGKFQSTNTDATHFTACKGTIRMDGCMFEGHGDDATNVHGYYQVVTKKLDSNLYRIQMEKAWGTHSMTLDYPDTGDTLELVSKNNLKTTEKYIVRQVDTSRVQWHADIRLDRPLPDDHQNYFLIDVTRLPRLEFVNSTVNSHLARAVLVKTRNVLIENCTFRESTGTAIHIGAEGDWREGPGSSNIIIRNNRIFRCGTGDGTNDQATAIAINVKASDISVPGVHQQIRIENNLIEGEQSQYGISVSGAKNVMICNNTFYGCIHPLQVKYSSGVTFLNNKEGGTLSKIIPDKKYD
ncbi:putative glycosidase [Flavihumibacter petaseus NBRC 106054]|uniref:Beta-galactosidase n=2 Tax=Flavihumibacter TaxID=1004301 RepID=A0A0E9N448_9BACT|nr:putative glycosidase [Flavihumibacter petaseus NBRC 106054]